VVFDLGSDSIWCEGVGVGVGARGGSTWAGGDYLRGTLGWERRANLRTTNKARSHTHTQAQATQPLHRGRPTPIPTAFPQSPHRRHALRHDRRTSTAGASPHRRCAFRYGRCDSTVVASPLLRCILRDCRCDSTVGATPHWWHAHREPVGGNAGMCPTGDAPSTTCGATAPRGRRLNGGTPSAKPVGADPGVCLTGEAP